MHVISNNVSFVKMLTQMVVSAAVRKSMFLCSKVLDFFSLFFHVFGWHFLFAAQMYFFSSHFYWILKNIKWFICLHINACMLFFLVEFFFHHVIVNDWTGSSTISKKNYNNNNNNSNKFRWWTQFYEIYDRLIII